ncbi:MAG: glutamine--fructose-6-phosphate transaminase (isomerizing) [Candidatus Aenigmatarchaeota archaeon]|nr:MAG: glutamine--fructose-6-phosphate transaminase (isomerizing) [Candidatus Aenigmarchaeota archaeon]
MTNSLRQTPELKIFPQTVYVKSGLCGIFGCVLSEGSAAPIIHRALERLEYRGYDSVGEATVYGGRVHVKKAAGKIGEIHKLLNLDDLPGSVGIGHTRWATHGKPSDRNAHPLFDCKENVAVVHNGIIENYQELKDMLIEKGHSFISDTDTEIIPHLIEENISLGLEKAVMEAVRKFEGRYAIAAISSDENMLVGVRRGSPLIVGRSENKTFIASDIPAFLNHTNQVMYLDDNEMVVIDGNVRFFNTETGQSIEKRLITINWDAKQAEKGEYPYFVIKEIMEQKETIMRAINQDENTILRTAEEIKRAYGTFFTGCGTAGKVCMAGEYIFSKVAKKHVNFVISSEFPNYKHFLTDKTLLITISQSGETADLMEAVETARKMGVKVLSLVNVMGSSLYRNSDYAFLLNAGPEKAVASTKATTAQLALVTLLAYAVAGRLQEGKRLLMETASKVNDMLNPRYEARIAELARKLKDSQSIYIIGRSLNYPMAMEAAIKIMELSNIHAQGFAGGELKHGPLALIQDGTPCIVFAANDETRVDIISNAMEVKARGGYIIGVSPRNNEVFDYWIKVPDVGNASPVVNIIPIQILAYHLALLRGCDPDYCRNLAKSVTVK